MILLVISLWTIAVVLLMTDRETETTRWTSAVAFFCGLGGFAAVWEDDITPFVSEFFNLTVQANQHMILIARIFSSITHFIAPYTILMFGMVSWGVLKNKLKKYLSLILLIPILVLAPVFPTRPNLQFAQEVITYYRIMSIWAVPYIVGGCIFLLLSYLREKNLRIKKNKLLTCIIVIPFITFAVFTNFVLRSFGIQHAWKFNAIVIVIQFIFFILFAAKYGILGVKLKFEKSRIDSTMKALTSGTAILNHTIKNEVCKISICMDNIKYFISQIEQKDEKGINEANQNIEIISNSTEHLSQMIQKIQEQVKDIAIDKMQNNLNEIVEKSIIMLTPYLRNKEIKLINKVSSDNFLLCDKVHIQEALNNILKNSIEAIKDEGTIEIQSFKNKKYITLSIKDSGIGISKENIEHVIDPFFSTKKRTLNFGLGLSYCYKVMQHHEGTLEIESEENKGTTIIMSFPIKLLCKQEVFISG